MLECYYEFKSPDTQYKFPRHERKFFASHAQSRAEHKRELKKLFRNKKERKDYMKASAEICIRHEKFIAVHNSLEHFMLHRLRKRASADSCTSSIIQQFLHETF